MAQGEYVSRGSGQGGRTVNGSVFPMGGMNRDMFVCCKWLFLPNRSTAKPNRMSLQPMLSCRRWRSSPRAAGVNGGWLGQGGRVLAGVNAGRCAVRLGLPLRFPGRFVGIGEEQGSRCKGVSSVGEQPVDGDSEGNEGRGVIQVLRSVWGWLILAAWCAYLWNVEAPMGVVPRGMKLLAIFSATIGKHLV